MLSLMGYELVDEEVQMDKTFRVSNIADKSQLIVFSGEFIPGAEVVLVDLGCTIVLYKGDGSGPKLFKVGNCEIVVTPN